MSGQLTDDDHKRLDGFLGKVLDAYRHDAVNQVAAVAVIAQVIAALDSGDIAEVRSWLDPARFDFWLDGQPG